MMAAVLIGNDRVTLDPTKVIGQGGEAVVYEHNGKALKIYHDKKSPILSGDPAAQKAAETRLLIHQKKLPAFPKNLPPQVIAPEELARDKDGSIVGFTMRYLKGMEVMMRYSDKGFRQAGIPVEDVMGKFRSLRGITSAVHSAGIVIGDYNDLNILGGPSGIALCDADSYQTKLGAETFYCRTFTHTFVDYLLCDPNATSLLLAQPHNENSDWYAYLVMLFQCLLFVHPFGGVYKPKNLAEKIPHEQRPLKRITVFHPEVRYPKPATPYGVLPDDFLQYCVQVFEKGKREPFPETLLDKIIWTKCSNCGMEHARSKCPGCAAPGAIKEVITVRGNVTASEIFKTNGLILHAASSCGKLRWLYQEGNAFYREDRSKVIDGTTNPAMRFRIQGDRTLIGMDSRLLILGPNTKEIKTIDCFGNAPMFDTNQLRAYWLTNGKLFKEGVIGDEYVGDALANQTLFWVGDQVGFGFYRAGNITTAFTFHPDRVGINDTLQLPPIKGQLIDSTCLFMKDSIWFLTSTNENGKIINRCYMISKNAVIGTAEAEAGDDSWLGSLRGKCSVASNVLMSATDDGIVRVENNSGRLEVVKNFPDTEPFLNSKSRLIPGDGGIYVVGANTITLLKIK